MKLVLLLTVLSLIYCTDAYKILCFYPTISKSQVIFAQPLMEALAEKGHEVTFVSQFPLGRKVKNYRDIVIPINFQQHEGKR